MVDVIMCAELEDGLVMWEDEVLHHGQRAGLEPRVASQSEMACRSPAL